MKDAFAEGVVRFDVSDVTVGDASSPEPTQTSSVETLFVSLSAEGGALEVADHLPAHERLLDFLIERSIAAWTRSQG